MTREPLHAQLRAAFEGRGLSVWELSRRANVRQSLVEKLVGQDGRAQLEVLERVASALDLEVSLAPRSPPPRIVGPVRSVVDEAVMRFTPEQCVAVVPAVPCVLALGLEGVLISSGVSPIARPGAHRFLTCCRSMFERIVMFATVPEARFRGVAGRLVDEGAAPAWFAHLEYVTWAGTTKDLRLVPGTDPSRVFLVDFEGEVPPEQHRQWIGIKGVKPPFAEADNELDCVLDELARRVSQKAAQ